MVEGAKSEIINLRVAAVSALRTAAFRTRISSGTLGSSNIVIYVDAASAASATLAFIVTGAAVAIEALITEPKSDVIDLNVGAAAAGQTSKRRREDAGHVTAIATIAVAALVEGAVCLVADLDVDAVTAGPP